MAAAPQSGSQSDNSAGILWGVAALFAAVGIVWYVFKAQIVQGYLYVKLFEINVINSIYSTPYFLEVRRVIESAIAHPNAVTFQDLLLIGGAVGTWLRIPIMVILIALAVIVYFWNATRRFKHTYNMRNLAKFEKVNWPQITPVTNLDLIKTDIDTGPWAMALTPMQFCKRYRLLEEVQAKRYEGMTRKDRDRIDVVLKRGETNQLFALQLGQVWRGPDKLPMYMRALFAAFAARINADSQSAAKLLAQLSASSATKLDFSGTDELLKKHINTKIVQQVVNSHAYVLTEMASMLERARDDGVQASADFLWLKPLDRRLWYTLNMVGRQTPYVEVAGIYAHWIAEKLAGRKLVVPMIEEATKALDSALKEVVYRPDEEEGK